MRSSFRATALAMLVALAGRPAARAQAPAPQVPESADPAQRHQPATLADPTVHRHLGFFIRPDVGFGYAQTSASSGSNTSKLSGGAGFVGVAIGGAVAENVILAGNLFGVGVSQPTLTVNGSSSSTSSTDTGLGGVGLEVDYYFMPVNLYLGATLAATKQTLTASGRRYETGTGVGAILAVGKEWWVSDHWGLGLAGKLLLSSNQDTGTNPPTWNAAGLSAVFSATYN